MRKPDTILDEIQIIRKTLYEATKEMTTFERVDYLNRRAESVANEFGFSIVKRTKTGREQYPKE